MGSVHVFGVILTPVGWADRADSQDGVIGRYLRGIFWRRYPRATCGERGLRMGRLVPVTLVRRLQGGGAGLAPRVVARVARVPGTPYLN